MTTRFTCSGLCFGLLALSVLLGTAVQAEDFRKNVVDPRPPHSGPNKPERDDDRHDRKHQRDKDGNIVIRGYTTIYVPSPGRIIVMQDQQILLNYLRQNLRPGFCPPGVVVSDTGCVPQNYVRRYQIGNGASQNVALEPLPPNLVAQLHPPYGYYYAQIDNDIVLVNQRTGKIVDAVTLVSPTY